MSTSFLFSSSSQTWGGCWGFYQRYPGQLKKIILRSVTHFLKISSKLDGGWVDALVIVVEVTGLGSVYLETYCNSWEGWYWKKYSEKTTSRRKNYFTSPNFNFSNLLTAGQVLPDLKSLFDSIKDIIEYMVEESPTNMTLSMGGNLQIIPTLSTSSFLIAS